MSFRQVIDRLCRAFIEIDEFPGRRFPFDALYGYPPDAVKPPFRVQSRLPRRVWAVQPGDCIARPTTSFYRSGMVRLTNEGSWGRPNWVAMDRNNDMDFDQREYEFLETINTRK